MKRNIPWPEIKLCYLRGEASLRGLSERFGVSRRTLERRCSVEGWQKQMTALCGITTVEAAKMAAEEGKKLGLTAGQFVQDTLVQVQIWLQRIENLANSPDLSPAALRQLVGSWREVIEAGRISFGIDRDGPASNHAIQAYFAPGCSCIIGEVKQPQAIDADEANRDELPPSCPS